MASKCDRHERSDHGLFQEHGISPQLVEVQRSHGAFDHVEAMQLAQEPLVNTWARLLSRLATSFLNWKEISTLSPKFWNLFGQMVVKKQYNLHDMHHGWRWLQLKLLEKHLPNTSKYMFPGAMCNAVSRCLPNQELSRLPGHESVGAVHPPPCRSQRPAGFLDGLLSDQVRFSVRVSS